MVRRERRFQKQYWWNYRRLKAEFSLKTVALILKVDRAPGAMVREQVGHKC